MHIDTKEKIAGVPILEVRKLLRHGQRSAWPIDLVSSLLKIDEEAAQTLITTLHQQGYIESGKSFGGGGYWQNTVKGNALALASAN